MDERLYPISLAGIDAWRRRHDVTREEARKRFVQFVILESIADAPWSQQLAFKGGNALRFVHNNPRGTVDLDFTAFRAFPDDAEQIRDRLNGAVEVGGRRFGLKAKCQSIHRRPPGTDKIMPTYDVGIGYAFRDDRHYADFQNVRSVSTAVRLEISINDEICDTSRWQLGDQQWVTLTVCALEDILAEKLRALLQQPKRNRHRRQDVYDIANMVRRHGTIIDRAKIGKYLLRKARARNIDARRSVFDERIKDMAAYDYATLFDAQSPDFIPFEDAWKEILQLVSELDIPA